MTQILIEIDMQKIRQFPVERIPEQIDAILKPHHMKWSHGNHYVVEEGYAPEAAVQGAIRALQETVWLKGAVHVCIERMVVKRRLEEIRTEHMKPPAKDKLEKARKAFQKNIISEEAPAYPNPIIIDEKNRLLDGYTTYLLMQESGMKTASCILVRDK